MSQARCVTAHFYRTYPTDLMTWAEAEVAVASSPYPMSARDLRRKYRAADRPVFLVPGLRGERVSRSCLLEFHRDLARGYTAASGRRTA